MAKKKDFVIDGPFLQTELYFVIRQRYGDYLPHPDVPRDKIYIAVPPDVKDAVLLKAFSRLRRPYRRYILDHRKYDEAFLNFQEEQRKRYFDVGNPNKNADAAKWTHGENARLDKGPWKATSLKGSKRYQKGANVSSATAGRRRKNSLTRQNEIQRLLRQIWRKDRRRTKRECLIVLCRQYSNTLSETYGGLSRQRIIREARPETKKIFHK